MTAPRPTEDELIARWFRPLATDPAAFGLGDDCAALTPTPGHDIVLKTDAVAEGIHFFADDPWDAIARKALRVNLSDLAAKGARPLGYLLSLALPADWRVEQLEAFAAGLAADQARYGVSLLGGDTIRAPSGLVVSVTVLGAVPTGRMARRGGASAGDHLYVSGTLGDAALGLALRLDPGLADAWGLGAAERDHLLARYLLPEPRLSLAPAVLAHAGAAMDVSDGLALDLGRLTREARLSAVVEVARVPLSAAAAAVVAAEPGRMRDVLTGGDDYEILAAVPPTGAPAFERAAAEAGVAVARIGEILAVPGAPSFLGRDRLPLSLDRAGFRHF